jgi:hypothetical protein
MRRFLNKLLGNSQTARTAQRGRQVPRRVTLQLEGLEDRMVPSASSVNMHAVVEATGTTVSVLHINDKVNNPLFEYTGRWTFQQIAPAGAVTDFSVGLDPTGHAAVFAHMNGVMQEWTQSTGWNRLYEPVAMAHFAAVQNGDLYAVANDKSLWQYTPPVFHITTFVFGGHIYHGGYYTGGWKELLGANTFISVDAVTSHGQDIVVGMNSNGQLSWYLPATGYRDSFSGSVNTYSVGLDTNGYLDVFVVFGDLTLGHPGHLQEYDPSQGGWQPIINTYGDLSPTATISATSGGECFVLSGNVGDDLLWEYRPNSSGSGSFVSTVIPGYGVSIKDFSAAGADNVTVMDSNGSPWQYSFSSFYGTDAWESW